MKKINSTNLAFLIVITLFLILILETITFIIGFKINNYCFFVALLTVAIYINRNKISVLETFIFLLILIISYFISILFFDISGDGQWYHQDIIIALKNGWNPVYHNYTSTDGSQIYVQHYSKGHETISASIYYLTGNIESGKMINILVAISCYIVSLQFFKKHFSKFKSISYAFIITFNPIVVTQAFTYYIDGFTYNVFIIFIFSIINYFKIQNHNNAILFIASISIFFSLKFTSLPILAITTFISVAYLIYKKRKLKAQFIRPILFAIIPIVLLCSHPYITNILENKSIFYPALEKNKNVLSVHIPMEIQEKNNIYKLFISLFSKTGTPDKNITSGLKIPYTFSLDEIKKLGNTTIVLGGFGVFFSGILINSTLIFIASLFYKLDQKNKFEILFFIIGLILYIIIFPEPWLARILPQIYILPILFLIFYEFSDRKIHLISILKNITIIFIYINIFLFISLSMFYNVFYSLKTHYILSELKKNNVVYCVQYINFRSNLNRLEDNGIKYKLCNLNDEKKQNLVFFEPKNLKYSTRIKTKLTGPKPTILIELENIYSKITGNKE